MISGQVVARCKVCNCRFVWSLDNLPFIDSEIIGTCSKCLNKESHDCYDEFMVDENGGFMKVGSIKFKNGVVVEKKSYVEDVEEENEM